ncbi:hypothetical protein GRS48_00235 [Halorubrum sp. JWXQ-INN 858]|uniref:hypothetical protein n=1 Tax=Halorubrum sp. JWXQ-INN 858 TaxID=2690782 RepID=UPI0013590AF1|nr:hypothetical protein [Halorubrum sp. JWXQ-INN 858]MWV63263.1 hypothetical protein [Halorubrum sp. JWXQ-INN 858]
MNDMPPPSETGDGADGDDRSRGRNRSRGRKRTLPGEGMAKVSLGISLLLAVAGFLYFYLQADYVTGVGIAVVFVLGGLWEYRRRRQDAIAADRYETDANDRRSRYRR